MCGEKQNSMCRHIYYSMLPSCYVVLWVFVGFMYRNFFSRVTCFYCQLFSLLAAAYKKNPFSCFIFVFIILFLLAVLLLFHDCLFDETCKMEHKFNVLQLFFSLRSTNVKSIQATMHFMPEKNRNMQKPKLGPKQLSVRQAILCF